MKKMARKIHYAQCDYAACPKADELIEAICQVMDKIVALSQRELRARAQCELQESQRLQRELKRAVELRGSLLARYTAQKAA